MITRTADSITTRCEGDINSYDDSTMTKQRCNDSHSNDATRMATLSTTMPMRRRSSNSGDNDDDTKVVAKAETTQQQRQQCHNDDTMATVATAVTETVGTTTT